MEPQRNSAPSTDLTLATALSGASWETQIVSEFDDRRDGIAVVRRCVDLSELLAVATSGIARAALVWPDLRYLDRDALAALASYGVAVVGVIDPAQEAQSTQRLHDLGVRHVVRADSGPAAIADVLGEAAEAAGVYPAVHSDPAQALLAVPPAPGAFGGAPSIPPVARGRVVAVWGPTGAPGRSTLALALADEASRLGVPTLLVDADVYGGVVGPMLGLLDESAGLAQACRLASAGQLDVAGLARSSVAVGSQLRVLSGISRVDRWPELRPVALEAVLDTARAMSALSVIDCGFSIEEDEELSYDTAAPRRNGATIAALSYADVVLCVIGPDPISMTRAVRAIAALAELLPETQPRIVVNRVRKGATGADPQAQLIAALQHYAGVVPSWFVPDDPAATDTALRLGKTIAEAASGSPVRAVVQQMVGDLTGVRPHARGRRRG